MPVAMINNRAISYPGLNEGIQPNEPVIIGFACNEFHEVALYLVDVDETPKLTVELRDFDMAHTQYFELTAAAADKLHHFTLEREKVGVTQWRYAATLLYWADHAELGKQLEGNPCCVARKISA